MRRFGSEVTRTEEVNAMKAQLTIAAALCAASLIHAPAAALPQSVAAPDPATLNCDQLAAELTGLTGGTMANAARAQELSKVGATDIVSETVKGQALGALGAMLPGAAASALATGVGIAEKAAEAKRDRKIDQALAESDALAEAQEGNLDRLLQLNELHQAKCAG